MIFILARDLEDARQWCAFNGVERRDSIYIGSAARMEGRRFATTDRVVRTALHLAHPDVRGIERVIENGLILQRLTETVHGNLVPRAA